MTDNDRFWLYPVALLTESVDRNRFLHAKCYADRESLSSRRAWIEMGRPLTLIKARRSLSSRRAWIEMLAAETAGTLETVALLTESVDRNHVEQLLGDKVSVALLTESVDRNVGQAEPHKANHVALLTESVDRNAGVLGAILGIKVALLTESVDRNRCVAIYGAAPYSRSPHGERG